MQPCSDTHILRGQVVLMKILQSRRKVSEAAKVTLSSVLLITLFEDGTWTCDTFLLGLLQWRSPVNDRMCVCVGVITRHCYLLMRRSVYDMTMHVDGILLIMVTHITALINNIPELECE